MKKYSKILLFLVVLMIPIYIGITGASATVTELSVQEDEILSNTLSLAFNVSKLPSNSGGNSGHDSSTEPSTEEITVDVESGSQGTTVSKTTIKRTKDTDGIVKDEVVLTEESAKETIQKLTEQGDDTARIIIPDEKDEVAEVNVSIPKLTLNELKKGKISLEIETANAKLAISNQTLAQFNEDLYFKIVPIKEQDEKDKVIERARQEQKVQEVVKGENIEVLGRPAEIHTNMQSQPVTITLPLKHEDLPSDKESRDKVLKNLAIFIEHSDGSKEVTKGKIITNQDGTQSVEFWVDKFSTFTMVYMEGWEEYLKELEQSEHVHDAYIHGYPDNTFKPNAPVTRAQMAAMLARNLGMESDFGLIKEYTDVLDTHWAFNDIMTVKKYGIMVGSGDSFNPNENITRAQMATIAYRWLKSACEANPSYSTYCKNLDDINEEKYSDVSDKHWASHAILAIKKTTIMEGYENGTFNPEGKLTRAQAVKVLNRLFSRGPLFGDLVPTFTDVPKDHWAFREIEEAARRHNYKVDLDGKETIIINN